MNSRESAGFRLELAREYLSRAEQAAQGKKWDECLGNAQDAVENAGKSVLAHFYPTPRTHDIIEPLESLLQLDSVPSSIQQMLSKTLDAFRDMGLETHVRATYGDEKTLTPPWRLIQEHEGRSGLDKARRAVALAKAVHTEMTGQSPQAPPDSAEQSH